MRLVDLSHDFGHGRGSYPGLPQPVVRDQLSFDDSKSRYEPGTEFNKSTHKWDRPGIWCRPIGGPTPD